VRLDDHGTLKDIAVVKRSGVDFLDQIAMDAFRKAQIENIALITERKNKGGGTGGGNQ
jgi:outer membrane biosynthesis protein TonB